MSVTDKFAPIKKGGSNKTLRNGLIWKLQMNLKSVRNYLKSSKKSKLHIGKDICNAAKYKVRKKISNKKRSFFEQKLSEFIRKPKDLWKGLKTEGTKSALGLPNKISSCEVSALKINNIVEHDANSILEGFKN